MTGLPTTDLSVLPYLYGFSVHRKPTFSTVISNIKSGREVTSAQQTLPLWEFELKYETLRDQTQNSSLDLNQLGFTQFEALSQIFISCNGQYGWFLFEDLTDCSRAGQVIGETDGSTTVYLLLRTIKYPNDDTATMFCTEPVGAVNRSHTFKVYFDGVEQTSGWSTSLDGTELVFDNAPPAGSVISVDMYYYYKCRFIVDEQEFEQFVKNWWTASLKFRSVIQETSDTPPLPSWAPFGAPPIVPPPVSWFAKGATADGNVEFWRFPPMSPGGKGTLSFWAKVQATDDFLALYGSFSGPIGAPNSDTMYFQPSFCSNLNFRITNISNAANAVITIVGDLTQILVGSQIYIANVNQFVPASPHQIIVSVVSTGVNTITVAWNTSALGTYNPSLNTGAHIDVLFISNITSANPAVITFSSAHGIDSSGGYTRVRLSTITQGGGWSGLGSGSGGVLVLGHSTNTITVDLDTSGLPAYVPLGNIVRCFIANAFSVFLANTGETNFVSLITTTALPPDEWVNVLCSWDMQQAAGAKKVDLYFNDSPVTVLTRADYTAGFNIDYGVGLPDTFYNVAWKVFGNGGVSGCGYAGEVAEFWFNTTDYIDFSDTSNRLKFHDVAGKAVDLGVQGEIPTGVAPTIYMGLNQHHSPVPDPNVVFVDPLGYGLSQTGGLIGTTTKFVLSFWIDRNTRGAFLYPDGYVEIDLNTNSDPPVCVCFIASTGSPFTQFQFEYDVGRGGNIRMQCDFTGGARDVIVYYGNTLATVTSTGDSAGEIAIAWDQGADFALFLNLRGYIGEFWFGPGQYFNVVDKFVDGSGNPVDLGPTGALPSGTAPVVFLHLDPGDPASAWGTNHGTGSNFGQGGSYVLVSGSRFSDNHAGTGDLIIDNEGNVGFLGYVNGPAP